jgi:hypothetical protein
MVSLSENSVVLDPHKTLTRTQQDALKAIAFYRRRKKAGSRWLIGDKRLSEKLISGLERLDLVDESLVHGEATLNLTPAGNLAVERLRH